MFKTNYSTDGDKFQNYYKDVSLRMKNKELDLLIVVNMFLTGFDSTTLNTLWVDKNLKMHGLIQSFSRTNRILNSIKSFGNIICFRNLQKNVESAIALFGNKDASGTVLMRTFDEYYYGYKDKKGNEHKGYVDLINELQTRFSLDQVRIEGKENQKNFIRLFGKILRMRNILKSFDEFQGKEILTERDFQDYLSRYQDLRDGWLIDGIENKNTNINDDIVFEVELIKQEEVDIDYILILVKKYQNSLCKDKEILVDIKKSVESSHQLRSKKELIEAFINNNKVSDDVVKDWHIFVAENLEKELLQIIQDERLKELETIRYFENVFRDGEIKTTGTSIDKLLPPISRFASDKRFKTKQRVINKFKAFFEKYYGVSGSEIIISKTYSIDVDEMNQNKVLELAEDKSTYKVKDK